MRRMRCCSRSDRATPAPLLYGKVEVRRRRRYVNAASGSASLPKLRDLTWETAKFPTALYLRVG